MQLSNAFSDACVAIAAIFIFFHNFSRIPFNNRVLWAAFFVTMSLAASAGVCRFLGMTQVIPIHNTLVLLAGTLGISALLAGIWVTVNQTTAVRRLLGLSFLVGLLAFFVLLDPAYKDFVRVIQSLGMLLGMLFAVWGLMKKYKKAIWIVVGIMIVGVATKITNTDLPLNPTDIYHFALVAMVWCFGKAV